MKILRNSVLAVLGVMLLAVVIGWSYAVNRLPKITGSIDVPIKESVSVKRDRYGVPHIEAKTAEDAYFALGFTVAQDRLFQMELQRRLAQGQLAEILGPALIDVDRQFLTFGYKRIAIHQLELEERSDASLPALRLLDAYMEGINHFIATQKLPIEYSLIGATARPFTRIDIMSMMAYMSFSFAEGHTTDSLFSRLQEKLPGYNIHELFPGYTPTDKFTIIEDQANFNQNSTATPEPPIATAKTTELSKARPLTSRSSVSELLGSIYSFAEIVPAFHGSNSWVIAPSRSESGGAILANDPHISLSNPAVWYEAHIKYDGFENYGYYIPVFPFPLLGHNQKRAWGLTMFENDDLNLYKETFHPTDNTLVMYQGKYVEIEMFKEIIKVKGQPDAEVVIRITPHGPIISDYLKGYEGEPLSMWWVIDHQPNPMLAFGYSMLYAKNLQEFEQSMSLLAGPGLNISYADSDGNIAWWAAAHLPVLPNHVHSRQVLDGASGKDEVTGYVPFAQNPKLVNPPSGIIVTANNLSTSRPVGAINELTGYFAPTDRATRITEMLSARQKWSVEALKQVQTDVHSQAAAKIQKELQSLIDETLLNATEKAALDYLLNWDGNARIDSIGATVYHEMIYQVLKAGVLDELGQADFEIYSDSMEHWNFFKSFIANDSSKYWNDINTEKVETRKEIVGIAFKNTVAELQNRLGSVNNWQWGKLHKIEYKHALGGQKPLHLIFNIGPYPSPGEAHFVNRLKAKLSKHDYIVTSNPSTRRIVDFANVDDAVSILPSGNSGNFMSQYYDDQVEAYLKGEYRSMILNLDRDKDQIAHELKLNPAQH